MWCFGHDCETIYFCNKAIHQGQHEKYNAISVKLRPLDSKTRQFVHIGSKSNLKNEYFGFFFFFLGGGFKLSMFGLKRKNMKMIMLRF